MLNFFHNFFKKYPRICFTKFLERMQKYFRKSSNKSYNMSERFKMERGRNEQGMRARCRKWDRGINTEDGNIPAERDMEKGREMEKTPNREGRDNLGTRERSGDKEAGGECDHVRAGLYSGSQVLVTEDLSFPISTIPSLSLPLSIIFSVEEFKGRMRMKFWAGYIGETKHLLAFSSPGFFSKHTRVST